MDTATTAERFRGLCTKLLDAKPEALTDAARFAEDLGADSLDFFELVIHAEDAFGIAISDSEADSLKTVGDAVAYIEKRLKE